MFFLYIYLIDSKYLLNSIHFYQILTGANRLRITFDTFKKRVNHIKRGINFLMQPQLPNE